MNLASVSLKVDTMVLTTNPMALLNDPMGQAIIDYAQNTATEDITVLSDICDDDHIPVSYLFREYDEMPEMEKQALNECKGRVLDIGAAAGMHAQFLIEKGHFVDTIDRSENAIRHLKAKGVPAEHVDFFDYKGTDYDTLLLLMNGIGIAKNLDNLKHTLSKAKSMLRKNGKILCDSSDIKYLYQDDKGGMWVDLNTSYYGNFKFKMKYKEHESEWFEWLYVDFEKLREIAEDVGFKVRKITEIDNQYLAELTQI